MNNEIFIARGNSKTGPYSPEQIKQMVAEGKVSLSDLAWHKGVEGWKPLEQIDGVSECPPLPTSTPPPLPRTASGELWQAKVALGATVLFVICAFALGSMVHQALYILANPPTLDQAFGPGGSTYDMDSNGDGLIGLAVCSFLVSVIFSIWLLGKDRIEKWKPIAMLASDVAAIILVALINAS